MVSALLFALLFSLDALFAGIAAGLSRVRVPWAAGLVIGLLSSLVLLLGGTTGVALSNVIGARLGRWLGATVLAALGLWILHSSRCAPTRASSGDRDASGHLSLGELIWLGVGLGADGFAGAAGLGLSGADPADLLRLGILLAVVTAIVFHAGGWAASQAVVRLDPRRTRVAAGWVFLLVGLLRGLSR